MLEYEAVLLKADAATRRVVFFGVRMRRTLLIGGLIVTTVALLVASRWWERRTPQRWTDGNLLVNADWSLPADSSNTPAGWLISGDVRRVDASSGYVLEGDRALRLHGINSIARSPSIKATASQRYRLGFHALVDPGTQTGVTPARLQVWVHWIDAAQDDIRLDKQPPVSVGYTSDGQPTWTQVLIETQSAPAQATAVAISLHVLGDDVVFIDNLAMNAAGLYVEPWPHGAQAAVSFSVDWETAMGGYIHTRAGDPYTVEQANAMGLRSRQGTRELLRLLDAHQFKGTWFANGYNFLDGNVEGRTWIDNPTFAWANNGNRWQRDWSQTSWFSDDPYGTVASHPGWYFGDLSRELTTAQQAIESHTFSHLYAGFTTLEQWTADLGAWRDVAALQSVAPAQALAFPWGSSGGMTAGHWERLEAAGVRAVVRTNLPSDLTVTSGPSLAIDRLRRQPRMLPGYDILIVPDLQLLPSYVDRDLAALEDTIAAGGVLDLWAHTSEITTPEEIAAWDALMDAAQRPEVWTATVPQISDYWRGIRQVRAEIIAEGSPLRIRVTNPSRFDLSGITVRLPAHIERTQTSHPVTFQTNRLFLNLNAGSAVEIDVWLQS